jgi:hypothetical protein
MEEKVLLRVVYSTATSTKRKKEKQRNKTNLYESDREN